MTIQNRMKYMTVTRNVMFGQSQLLPKSMDAVFKSRSRMFAQKAVELGMCILKCTRILTDLCQTVSIA